MGLTKIQISAAGDWEEMSSNEQSKFLKLIQNTDLENTFKDTYLTLNQSSVLLLSP